MVNTNTKHIEKLVRAIGVGVVTAGMFAASFGIVGCSANSSSSSASASSNASSNIATSASSSNTATTNTATEETELSPFVAFWDIQSITDKNGNEISGVAEMRDDKDFIYDFAFYPSGNLLFRMGNVAADGTWTENPDGTATVTVPYLSENSSVATLSEDGTRLYMSSDDNTLECKARLIKMNSEEYNVRLIPEEKDATGNYTDITNATTKNTAG